LRFEQTEQRFLDAAGADGLELLLDSGFPTIRHEFDSSRIRWSVILSEAAAQSIRNFLPSAASKP
jgi:hypothetical protein